MSLEYELSDDISLEASGVIHDGENGKFEHRCYKNGVSIEFVINENEKRIHLLYIESSKKSRGNASAVIKSIQEEFCDYLFELEAIPGRASYYKLFDFVCIGVNEEIPAIKMAWKNDGKLEVDLYAEQISMKEVRLEDEMKKFVDEGTLRKEKLTYYIVKRDVLDKLVSSLNVFS